MKKTILALMIPALFATSASAVEIYSAEDGSKIDLYGRLQYNAGALDYQKQVDANGRYVDSDGNITSKSDAADSGSRNNFGGDGLARLGVNVKYVLDDATDLIGKYEANLSAESDQSGVTTRYAWLGFRFMDTTDLTFGKSEAPRAMLTDLTDTFDIFGGEVTKATSYNRIDDQVRVAYAENGVDLRAAYSFSDDRKQNDNEINVNDKQDNRWGLAAGYTAPMGLGFVASYDVINNDNVINDLPGTNPSVNGTDNFDKSEDWGLGAHYTFEGFYFAGLYGQRDYKVPGADDLGTKYWEVQGAYNIDQWTLIANYANEKGRKALNKKLTSEYTLAARYAFTPKTKVYAEYVINDFSGQDDLYGVGIQYNF